MVFCVYRLFDLHIIVLYHYFLIMKLLNVRNAEECANDREEWKQYIVAAMFLKGL